MLLRAVEDQAPRAEQPLSVASTHPLYAVDLDQRITYWEGRGLTATRPAEEALGRRCYEVLAGMDPRNASFCRPNCPVISQARAGRPAPDFEVWSPIAEDGTGRVGVTILLQQETDGGTRVIHMLRKASPAPRTAFGEVRRGRAGRSRSPQPEEDLGEGRCLLTPRQISALRLLAEGCSPEEIATTMDVQPITVRNHIQAAMDRLGARSRLEAVIIASRFGLLSESAAG